MLNTLGTVLSLLFLSTLSKLLKFGIRALHEAIDYNYQYTTQKKIFIAFLAHSQDVNAFQVTRSITYYFKT